MGFSLSADLVKPRGCGFGTDPRRHCTSSVHGGASENLSSTLRLSARQLADRSVQAGFVDPCERTISASTLTPQAPR
jgi:hypothetical protein